MINDFVLQAIRSSLKSNCLNSKSISDIQTAEHGFKDGVCFTYTFGKLKVNTIKINIFINEDNKIEDIARIVDKCVSKFDWLFQMIDKSEAAEELRYTISNNHFLAFREEGFICENLEDYCLGNEEKVSNFIKYFNAWALKELY